MKTLLVAAGSSTAAAATWPTSPTASGWTCSRPDPITGTTGNHVTKLTNLFMLRSSGP